MQIDLKKLSSLSEEAVIATLKAINDFIDWTYLSGFEWPFSDNVLEAFIDNINFENFVRYNALSEAFIIKYKYKFEYYDWKSIFATHKLSLDTLKKTEGYWDVEFLSIYSITDEILKYYEYDILYAHGDHIEL